MRLKKLMAVVIAAAFAVAAMLMGVSAAGNKTTTIMIYMCGSDLESEGACATADIKEIIKGYSGKNVNLLILTGGATEWHYKGISAKTSQIFKVESGKLQLVSDLKKLQNMGKASTLSDFIKYCKKNYKADRYGLVFWDHGGSSISGVCVDTNYDADLLTMGEMSLALKAGGTKFDFIGFDACLMGNLETVLTVKDYCNYMVASENSESGEGWYYTDWVKKLCKDPTMDTKTICKNIVDAKIAFDKKKVDMTQILAVYDTKAVVKEVLPALNEYAESLDECLYDMQYAPIARDISKYTVFGGEDYEVVDILNFAGITDDGKKLEKAINKAVVHVKTNEKTNNIRGMSVSVPFIDLETVDFIDGIYRNAGYKNTAYMKFIKHLANIKAGGQKYFDSSVNYKRWKWYDPKLAYSKSDYKRMILTPASKKYIDVFEEENGYYITFTADQHDAADDWSTSLFLESDGIIFYLGTCGDAYIRDDNSIYVTTFDTWFGYQGELLPVKYLGYDVIGEKEYTYYSIPCVINDNTAEIYFETDGKNAEMYGYAYTYDGVAGRMMNIKKGLKFAALYTVFGDGLDDDGEQLYDDFIKIKSTKIDYISISENSDDMTPYISLYILDVFGNQNRTDVYCAY